MIALDETHDPDRTSWVSSAGGHRDFPVQNLPLGVFSPAGGRRRIGTAIGDRIVDLSELAALLPPETRAALAEPTLNALFALPGDARVRLRSRLSALLSDEAHRAEVEPLLHAAADCTMALPTHIGDYTDFYVGIHHARNVGALFRPDAPLLPNYKWVPIGYHGRASSVRPSGVEVVRPSGQRKPADAERPVRAPTARLDYELELGVWVAGGNPLGKPIAVADAHAHVAGLGLLNDWSARDVQAWEYQPLGPFLSKSFHTTVSPWIVTAEALAPFRIAPAPRPEGDPRPLDYLWNEADQAGGGFNIALEVCLSTRRMRAAGAEPHRLSRGPAGSMYWTVAQMIAHHASNGCNLAPGDLLGTGTLSGPDPSSYGSLLEITRGGAEPIALPGGETRTFLEDGDVVAFTATATAPGRVPIGFGECRAMIVPASA